MSAFMAVALEDSVEILTDGASVGSDGTLILISRKVHTYPGSKMAYTGRGNVGACMMVHATLLRLAECGSFDETVASFADELAAGLPKTRGSKMDGLLAGLSERDGPVLLYFTTLQTEGSPDAFILHPVGPVFGCGPDVPEEALTAVGLPERALAVPFHEWGLAVMDVWRRFPMTHFNAGGHKVFGVGAHVDHTTITAEGVTTERLRTWPEDVPGRKIEPEAVAS